MSSGSRYQHPLGWYSLAVPVGFTVEEDESPLKIVAPERNATVRVSVAKIRGTEPRASMSLLQKMVRGLSVVERRNAEEGEARGMRFARCEEIVARGAPWWAFWRREFWQRPPPEAHIFTACFSRGPLLALFTFEVPPSHAARHRLAADAMIASLDLAPDPMWSPEEFVERFLALARTKLAGRRVERAGPLSVSIDGTPLSLDQPYRALACDRGLGEGVFERVFRFLEATASEPRGEETYEKVASRLLPSVKPAEWLASADAQVPERHRVLRIPFPNETAVVFVIDQPHAMRFVTKEESDRWEVPPKEMLRVSRENLARLRPELSEHAVVGPDGSVRAVAVVEGDGYDAARLLLPGVVDRLRERLGAEVAVAIPNRDFLIAFAADDPEFVEVMRKRVAEDAKRRPYPITEKLFRIAAGGRIEAYFGEEEEEDEEGGGGRGEGDEDAGEQE